jgi:hypothetical protein
VYYNCVKFHKNSISSLVGVALTRYMPPPPFRESISGIISPFKFWTATIFLHAHLQVVYYDCAKFHKTPISRLEGVALTRYPTPLFVQLYTVVVHNLQMCMKKYCCCLKFRRGDDSTYTFTKRGVVYLVSATPSKRLIGVL